MRWANNVSCATVRRRADRAARVDHDEAREAETARSFSWWWIDEGKRLGLEGELPAAQGAIVVRAIERASTHVPLMPDEGEPWFADARRADALVALCSAAIATDPDTDRATVVVHARATDRPQGTSAFTAADLAEPEIEGGTAVPRSTLERLLCDARLQLVLEGRHGEALGMGRLTRDPSPGMLRQLRYRDRGCRFPGCGTNAFTQAHHIVWWSRGGRTDLDNLVLICSFHHRLVHEPSWSLRRRADGALTWRRPDGTRYRAGPSPEGQNEGRYSPKTVRRTSLTSPSVARARSAAFIGGSRLSVPRAADSTSASALSTVP